MEYRNKLNPEHSLRMAHRIKGMRQKIIVIHNITSTIKFPNLGSDSVIICGTANLFFNIKLSSMAYPNRMIVSNIGRAIVKNLAVKFKGNEILSIDNFDVIACYRDLWKTKSEKRNATRQGISNDGCTVNCMKLHQMLATRMLQMLKIQPLPAHMGQVHYPLDFKMLDSMIPYYQSGLGNRLHHELKFNDYD